MNATALQNSIYRFRIMEGDMTVRRLEVLLFVYRRGETTTQEIIRTLGMIPSSVTKIVQSWSALTRDKKQGPKYIVAEADPMNLSTKIVKITPKGKRAVELLLDGEGETEENQDTQDL